MSAHAYKGRGTLTIGGTTLEVATEMSVVISTETVAVPTWAATGSPSGGVVGVAQRPRAVYVEMLLHDYAPAALANALGGSSASGAVGICNSIPTSGVALSFSGSNKVDGTSVSLSVSSFLIETAESVPVLGGSFGAYRIRGHALRVGDAWGTLTVAT